MRRYTPVVALVVGLLTAGRGIGADEDAARAADEKRIQQIGLKNDGESLLNFFKQRTVRVDQDQVRSLVRQLSSRSFAARKRASAALISLGARAIPLLREATRDEELEVRRRAEDCLAQIKNESQPDLILAAARLLARHKPAGAAEALIDFLPSVLEDHVIRRLHGVLADLAVRDGKPDAALVKALGDEIGVRRAAAAVALSKAGVKEVRDKIKALLRDPDPTVRVHAGLALLTGGDKEPMPVLIGLFGKASRNELWQVEDALYKLAGDKAPSVALGETEESVKTYRDAWLAWWKQHGDKIDVVKGLEEKRRDYTLLVLLDESVVLELDAKDNERFRMEKVEFPLDAQTLPGERVLLAEHGGSRVTERLRDGTVLWEKKVGEPLAAQRLENGNTFIGTKTAVMEVDREGKVVFSWTPPEQEEQIMRTCKLPDGTFAVILHSSQRYVRLDATGKELDGFSFNVNVHTFGGRIDVQADGSVLIPQMYLNKVVEYDAKGKTVREFNVSQPIVAARMPNGNTIITSMNENRAVELDLAGKQVWEYRGQKRVTRAYRR